MEFFYYRYLFEWFVFIGYDCFIGRCRIVGNRSWNCVNFFCCFCNLC